MSTKVTMGCFDYCCECGGKKCNFVGEQDGGDSTVIVEVPLNDGTTIFVKGNYDSYGAVEVGEYTFYPEQFEEFFKGWLTGEPEEKMKNCFVAKRIWTLVYTECEDNSVKIPGCFPNKDVIVKTKIGKETRKKLIPIKLENL